MGPSTLKLYRQLQETFRAWRRKPLVLPDPFSGVGSWDDWSYHFGNVAEVNRWDAAAILCWLKVRLTGRAQKDFQRLPAATKASYELTWKALGARFEPHSKKELYVAELQARRKKPAEGRPEYAEDLGTLVDKAFPSLEDAAREQIALTNYLGQLTRTETAFSVKQRQPTMPTMLPSPSLSIA